MNFFLSIWNQQFQSQQYKGPVFSNFSHNTAENLYLAFQYNFNFANNDYIYKLIKNTYFAISDYFATDYPIDRE